jgi:hypothetical protein
VDNVVMLHSGNGEHRDGIELGVVKTVQQMDSAGARCAQAAAKFASHFGVTYSRECRALLVSAMDEFDIVLALTERFHHSVDTIAGHSEDVFDAPLMNYVDENITAGLRHIVTPFRCFQFVDTARNVSVSPRTGNSVAAAESNLLEAEWLKNRRSAQIRRARAWRAKTAAIAGRGARARRKPKKRFVSAVMPVAA